MKENISKNKVWQIIGVAVLCAVCVLTAVLGVVFGMNHSSEDLNVSKDMSNNDIVVNATEENGIMLTSGVATTAADGTTSKVLTATISPSNALTDGFTWSVAFKNASSNWAKGKTVTDYVTVTKDTSSDLKATVTCKKAFGEQIVVTIKCDYTDASASATLDYKARVASGSVKFTGLTSLSENITLNVDGTSTGNFTFTGGLGGYQHPKYTLSLNDIVLSDGTIKGSLSVRIVDVSDKNLSLFAGKDILDIENQYTFEFEDQTFEESFSRTDLLCVQLLVGGEVVKEWNVGVNEPQFASSVSLDVTTIVF